MDNLNLFQVRGLERKAVDPKLIKPGYKVVTIVTFNTGRNKFNP